MLLADTDGKTCPVIEDSAYVKPEIAGLVCMVCIGLGQLLVSGHYGRIDFNILHGLLS